MLTTRYGKSSSSLLNQKKSFFEENEQHLEKQRKIALIYKKQPRRINCKNCSEQMFSNSDFVKDDIGYVLCNHCHHLNGIYEDSDEFCNYVYTADTGKAYSENYKVESVNSFNYRVATIYLPKAEFLYTSLLGANIDPNDMEYLDFGSGSGYFVSALRSIGISQVSGTDVSRSQVDFGNIMMAEELLSVHRLAETTILLRDCKAQVVSMIGVLEHLQHPREVFRELNQNDNVKFVYLSVPTFSLSSYLEIISPDVFNRQLHGGHTHLYTEKSLAYICKEFNFEVLAEWWFGTDMVDLLRIISVTLGQRKCSKKLKEMWEQDFTSLIDALQLEVDKKHFSSEVHMILRKK